MIQIKKTILTLVALLAVTTGAWATDETLLTTITPTGKGSYSETTAGVVTVTPSNMRRYSGDYGWLWSGSGSGSGSVTVEAKEGYTITKCVFKQNDKDPVTITTSPFAITFDESGDCVQNDDMDGVTSIEVYAPAAPAASGPEVAWNKAEKTGTFTMPGGNVTLEPEYYPQATLAFQGLTAAEDAAAKTEAPLAVLADGAVTGGTLMYYVATDKNFSQADAIALAETQWSADIPTAETIDAAGTYIMWYYIKGDAEHSDTDPIPLVVTLLPEPTYTVEFAEGTPETDKWKADPATGVTKGTPVTVTYTGSKKVIGVKAEKKAKAPALKTLANATAEDLGKIAGADGNIYDTKAAAEAAGTTAVAMIAYVGSDTGNDTYTHGMALALSDEGEMNWSNAKSTCEGKSAVSGAAWLLPSRNQWKAMFKANGGNEGSYTGLNTAVATAGGDSSKLQKNERYWSSSEQGSNFAWVLVLGEDSAGWDGAPEDLGHHVRACLAF